jgi:hypothetical protein
MAPKIYIPEYYQKTPSDGEERKDIKLWHKGDGVILDYVGLSISPPQKALRFSYISHWDWELQMLIPSYVVNNNGLLDLWSECFPTKEKLLGYSDKIVKWEDWVIDGELGSPSPETRVPWLDDV